MCPTGGSVDYRVAFGSASSLTGNFNKLWAQALAMHDAGQIDYFAMLHSDIGPEPRWLDKLFQEMAEVDADVISVVVPFKDGSEITSTAIGLPGDPWAPLHRLNVPQACTYFPSTFGQKDAEAFLDQIQAKGTITTDDGSTLELADDKSQYPLLINTGCMLIRMDRDWVHERTDTGEMAFAWEFRNRIVPKWDRTQAIHVIKKYDTYFEPEDWRASRHWHARGVRVYATTAVTVYHSGIRRFLNAYEPQLGITPQPSGRGEEVCA